MNGPHVDYDQLASTYNRRFEANNDKGIAIALLEQARGALRILEVGCGTGHWLAGLAAAVPTVCGLDLSAGMLHQAQDQAALLQLARGYARTLPFQDGTFDLVYCVHAIHHFRDPQRFIQEAFRLLKPGGRLAVVGSDPHGWAESWYIYHYFEGVYEMDLARFPTWETVRGWMLDAEFEELELQGVQRILEIKKGRAVLSDPFLEKHACSQLALLSDTAYATGLRRIEADIESAEAQGETITFRSEIAIQMLLARKPS